MVWKHQRTIINIPKHPNKNQEKKSKSIKFILKNIGCVLDGGEDVLIAGGPELQLWDGDETVYG